MDKKKEIITNYRKRLQELDNVVIRSKVNLLNQIKKETLSNLLRLGEGEFEALEILEKIEVSSITCHKCGSNITCPKC
jgi:hypothetical protein